MPTKTQLKKEKQALQQQKKKKKRNLLLWMIGVPVLLLLISPFFFQSDSTEADLSTMTKDQRRIFLETAECKPNVAGHQRLKYLGCHEYCDGKQRVEKGFCAGATRTGECTKLPENAERNTATSITQTRDGGQRLPSEKGTYNETPSASECRFKCSGGMTRDTATSTCKVSCHGAQELP